MRDEGKTFVVFFGDTRGIFDEILFENRKDAEAALARNGFKKYQEELEIKKFVPLPEGRFHVRAHPNGPIYSSGRFWD
jgi:hypothetical protein